MKKNERTVRQVRKEMRSYVTSIADTITSLQKKADADHGELLSLKNRVLAAERRLDRREKKD